MSAPNTKSNKVYEALIKFQNSSELLQLDELLNQFNIFEAIGIIRQEIRHSNFIAFLLDPKQSHDLKDEFAKNLLRELNLLFPQNLRFANLKESDDFTNIEVSREWENIDVLLVEKEQKFAIIIENKIDSGERIEGDDGGQLEKYWKIVEDNYPEFNVIGLYLSREGSKPSHSRYLPIGYKLICRIITALTERTANNELQILMRHYTEMLRRHIMNDSEINTLCEKIYKEHYQAIETIFKNQGRESEEMAKFLQGLISQDNTFIEDYPVRGRDQKIVRFFVKELDVELLKVANNWTRSNRILLFEFWINKESLTFGLTLGPGVSSQAIDIREKIVKMANDVGLPFRKTDSSDRWPIPYYSEFLKVEDYEKGWKVMENEIRQKWNEFTKSDLPKIIQTIKSQSWFKSAM